MGYATTRSAERVASGEEVTMKLAERGTGLASLLRDKLTRADDARALPRQIYDTEVDLIPDLENQTLTVRLHHLTQAAHDEAVRYLCDQLNATATIFPDTDLRLVYQLGAAQIP